MAAATDTRVYDSPMSCRLFTISAV